MPPKGEIANKQFAAKLRTIFKEAEQLGLFRTMHAIDSAQKIAQYEAFGIPTDKQVSLYNENTGVQPCKKHPKYKAIKEPKVNVNCQPCWDYFYKKNW